MRRGLAAVLLALGLVPFAWAGAFPQQGTGPQSRQVGCGVERWKVKTLADRAARKLKFTPKQTTIPALRRRAVPASLGKRIRSVETTTFRVRAALVEMKLEDDSDIHLVVADPRDSSATLIVEFPDPSCTKGAARQARAKMRSARTAFIAACGSASRSFTRLQGEATIAGVGFFDFLHGQRGGAPNGIELHPAVGFSRATCQRAPGPPPPPPGPPPPPPPPPPSGNCHASYPTVCIPPAPPDLDCSDISFRNFRVRWDVPDPDPHGFDGNRDGLGCES